MISKSNLDSARPSLNAKIPDPSPWFNCLLWLISALVIGFVWLSTIDHLRIEWTINESYSYGWAVPVLCLLLLHRRWTSLQLNAESTQPIRPVFPGNAIAAGAMIAILFVVTKWIGVANPDWRLVSGGLAIEAIGLSLVFVGLIGGRTAVRQFAFPILFFLVAVPWPSRAEQIIVQVLTQGIVATTSEVLNLLGHVAIRHGNVIETAGGLVDVDRACSGIRSLQAALMLSLFFGEWHRLAVIRRVILCGIAFALACFFNLARTLVLSLVATQQGSSAVERWHDATGIVILVGCFIGVWVVARGLARNSSAMAGIDSRATLSLSSFARTVEGSTLRRFAMLILSLLLIGETATCFWYRTPSRSFTSDWTAELPRQNPTFKTVELPPAALQILRFNDSQAGAWQNPDGTVWQMIYLRWHPGRAAVQLARNHTPDICLPAAGKSLSGVRDLEAVSSGDSAFPFRCYETEQRGRPLFVFYTLWEEGLAVQHTGSALLTWEARWNAVLHRQRNPGQRVIQIAIWGARDPAHAEGLLRSQLPHLIRITQKSDFPFR